MPFKNKTVKNALEQALNENGFIIVFEGDYDYFIIQKDVESKFISLQLQISESVDICKQSHDKNELFALSIFKLNIPIGGSYPDYYLLSIQNPVNGLANFIIIPSNVLSEKLFNQGQAWKCKADLHILQYSDNKVFDITNLSHEGKWYLLRKGVNGRMIDDSERDISKYLNISNILIKYSK